MLKLKRKTLLVTMLLVLVLSAQVFAAGEVATFKDMFGPGSNAYTNRFDIENGVVRVNYSATCLRNSNWDFHIGLYRIDNYGNRHYITGETISDINSTSVIQGTKTWNVSNGKYQIRLESNNYVNADVKVYDLGY